MSFSSTSSKRLTFVALMSALGNVLSFISITVSPIIPSIFLGPISVSLALDLSHITTFIAALFGGPVVGGFTGMVGGLVAAYKFGFSQGNFITGFGLPLGKALTGVAAGLIVRILGVWNGRRLLMLLTTIVSYIPEAVYTAILFIVVFPQVFGIPLTVANVITVQILTKAFAEMVIMGLILSMVMKNQGFAEYIKGFFI